MLLFKRFCGMEFQRLNLGLSEEFDKRIILARLCPKGIGTPYGHNVNSKKTNIFFSKGVEESMSVLLTIPSYFMQSIMIPRKICDEIEFLVRRFIWGTSDGKKKMSLVGWDSICQPKWCGGLGMRQLRDQNISFFLKLGYKVVSDEEALWVRVLRSKYGLNGSLPTSIAKARSSFL
ncbi:endonuclease/exonuclease/phosphatase family protein [Gossypium australe]|uniref:Endonuclease/exonuclease/phosphatase family protein n=1 Tax=Gossypium australe TaxID=47621 RepID=A0A5B6W763_9ROSI|nr:endonuclease/exonuclease/phosphatase family protein [Gossypium australe]